MTDLADISSDVDDIAFEVVEPEIITADEVGEGVDEQGREDHDFVCPLDGDFFPSQRGLNVHIGLKHPERADLQKRSPTSRRRRSGSSDPTSVSDVPDVKTFGAKPSNAAKPVQKFILEEINGFIVTGMSLAGVPDQVIDIPIIEGKSLKQHLSFSPREATIIAEGVVRMNGTPVVKRVADTVGPVVPYFFGGMAVLVVVLHVAKAFMLRSKLQAIADNPNFKQLMAAQQQQQSGTDQGQKNGPPGRAIFI